MLTNEESLRLYSLGDFFFLPWFLIGKLDSCAIVCVPNAIISDRLPRLKELTKPFAISCRGKNWMNNESEWEEKISARRKIHLRLLNCRWLFISGKQLKFLLVLASNERANIQKKNYILLWYDGDDSGFIKVLQHIFCIFLWDL